MMIKKKHKIWSDKKYPIEREISKFIRTFRHWWCGEGKFKPKDWLDKIYRLIEKTLFVFMFNFIIIKLIVR